MGNSTGKAKITRIKMNKIKINKRASTTFSPAAKLIIALIVIGIIILAAIAILTGITGSFSHKICEWTIKAKAETKFPLITWLFGKSAINEVCIFDPVLIKKNDNVAMEIAHATAQVWEDMGAGETNPDSVSLLGQNKCYAFQEIIIDNGVKPLSFEDFKKYLMLKEVPPKYFKKGGYNYWDFLHRKDLKTSKGDNFMFKGYDEDMNELKTFKPHTSYMIVFINDNPGAVDWDGKKGIAIVPKTTKALKDVCSFGTLIT